MATASLAFALRAKLSFGEIGKSRLFRGVSYKIHPGNNLSFDKKTFDCPLQYFKTS